MCVCARMCFSIRMAVCLCPVGWIAKQSRADGFIMRKQNYSDNDDQIIIRPLKEGGRRGEGGSGGLKRELNGSERRGVLVHKKKGLRRAGFSAS